MKVVAIVGSARKKHSYKAAEAFLKNLEAQGNVESEILALADYKLGICRGCKLCLDRGEELCPMRDDRDILLEKIRQADGLVLVSPNYSFQVSGLMKVFLDRLGFIFHRPEFFGKTCTSIVAQGVYGGKKILQYLDFVGRGLGYNVVKGSVIQTLEPVTEKTRTETEKQLLQHSRRFHRQLVKMEFPVPSLFKLMVFRMSRTNMQMQLDELFCDYRHYTEQGWFQSDYYYPVRMNPLKKAMGRLFDYSARKMMARD